MMGSAPLLTAEFEGERLEVRRPGPGPRRMRGSWKRWSTASRREAPKARSMSIDMAHVRGFDTFGAWLLERLTRLFSVAGGKAEIVGLPAHDRKLLEEMHGVNRDAVVTPLHREQDRLRACRSRARADWLLARSHALRRDVRRNWRRGCARRDAAERFPIYLGRQSARSRGLAGGADHSSDHLPDRRHHLAARHFPLPQIRCRALLRSISSAFWCCARSVC